MYFVPTLPLQNKARFEVQNCCKKGSMGYSCNKRAHEEIISTLIRLTFYYHIWHERLCQHNFLLIVIVAEISEN